MFGNVNVNVAIPGIYETLTKGQSQSNRVQDKFIEKVKVNKNEKLETTKQLYNRETKFNLQPGVFQQFKIANNTYHIV